MASKPTGAAPSGDAAKKRKAGGAALSGRSDTFMQKRAQVHIARTIPAQPAESALKDGELDLQAFVAAHEFEIRSLEQSMATSKAINNTRAFQQVPRGLRRRTASHNPKRVPRRLRARARREMADDNTPMVESRRRKPRTTRARIRSETAKKLGILAERKRKRRLKKVQSKQTDESKGDEASLAVIGRKPRPKIRRNELNDPPTPAARFRKRQINKTWLPTHAWHAKRARMTDPKEPLWRFAIPLTPNEKIYRPAHRAQGDRGALVWEMSYISTIGLYGNAAGIERVLKRVGVTQDSCWNEKGRKWRMGTRSWTGVLSREKGEYKRQIGPSTILWNPESQDEKPVEDAKKQKREVFLRIHPSAFLELFNELVRLTKMENPRLYIEDLRFEIGSIELTGPASTETLLSVLSPYSAKGKTQHANLFESLAGLTNPASLPAGAILSFKAQDPRLRYPPRRMQVSHDEEAQMKLLETMAEWPAEEALEPYAIFSRDARYQASLLPSQGSLNRRRSKGTPGNYLKPTKMDPPIPITLLATRAGNGTQTQGSWTLLAPWKCIQPIWYSIVHCPLASGGNPRFAGVNESQQVAFERGLPWFPTDFLGTDAGADWELEQRRKRRRAWERRPKSKRTEWKTLDLGGGRRGEIGNGLACDFEFLFGLDQSQHEGPETEETPVSGDAMDVDQEEQVPKAKQPKVSPLHLLHQIPKDTFNGLLSTTHSPIPANAVITVRISLLARGVASSCARIYSLPSGAVGRTVPIEAEVASTIPPPSSSSTLPQDLRAQWLSRIPPPTTALKKSAKTPKAKDLETRKRLLAQELTSPPEPYPPGAPNESDIGGHPLVPDADHLIGFVTTGSFSLSEGRGVAIGCLSVEKALHELRSSPNEGRLCIVRNAGENVGWIAKWEVL